MATMVQTGGVAHIAPPYTPGYEVVTFVWRNEYGHCYDCNLPAAFYLPLAYGGPAQPPNDTNKRCAVCAANAAAEGETVRRIEEAVRCTECDEYVDQDDPHAGHGMCASCLHDALRSGWTPGQKEE